MNNKLPLLLFAALFAGFSYAQELPEKTKLPPVGIKTNLLYDATGSMNLGIEFRTGDKTSLDVSGNWNPWTFGQNRKWKHILVQPELRLWTKEAFAGHFFGFHAHYAYYNVGNLPGWLFSQNMQDSRYQGWLAGAGVGYGYRWNFSRHWAMEAEIGVGYAYLDYDKYECGNCGVKLGSGTRNYFGPTKAAVSLIYSFGHGKKVVPAPEPIYVPPVVVKLPVPQAPAVPVYAVAYLTPEVETVKRRSESGKAYLDFAVGKSEIVSGFKRNAVELQKIHEMITAVKNDPDATMTGIAITGYASPEGTYHSNLILSEKRAAALKRHVQSIYGFPHSFFVVEGKGEDWQELDALVSQSAMVDKYRVLEIIRGTDVFDGREKKLMDISGGGPYREMLATMFPQLRRSEYELQYTVVPFTIEKGKEVFKVKPSSLSLNEMFLIANTYPQGSTEFNEVFETAARIFPHDDTANLNAAANALARKDAVSAEHYLGKVNERGHDAAWYNNMGVLCSLQGEYDKAAAHFERAGALGNEQAARNLTPFTQYREELRLYEKAKYEYDSNF